MAKELILLNQEIQKLWDYMNKVILSDNCTLYHGNCLEVMQELKDIHACVTYPPYNLGFMGKEWDKSGVSFNSDTWKIINDTLLPGAHLLSFAGTRTYHRIASAIEDSGFEIRDMISWIYGCLSEDTHLINEDGNITSYTSIKPNDKVLVYDKYTKEFFYSEVEEIYEYNIKDTCYRIQSDFTDQIVSRNHRCLVERSGKEIFIFAEDLQEKENIPFLENVFNLHEAISNNNKRTSITKQNLFSEMCQYFNFSKKQRTKKTFGEIITKENLLYSVWERIFSQYKTYKESQNFCLQQILQWYFTWKRMEKTCLQGACSVDSRIQKTTKNSNDWKFQSFLERWNNISPKSWKLQRSKIYSLLSRIYFYGKKRWLCNGTSIYYGKAYRKMFDKNRSCSSYRSQFIKQCNRKSNVISHQCGTQGIREWSGHKTSLATIIPFEYEGIIWCIKVKTGAFVAIRNGKAFVTGNSGFPKSHNISKAIDKMKGVNFEEIPASGVGFMNPKGSGGYNVTKHQLKQIGESSEEAKSWEGWGTALKPACEPICFARKPLSEKTIAENVLKYGTGAINIDDCRVELFEGDDSRLGGKGEWNIRREMSKYTVSLPPKIMGVSPLGRFPANIIHDGSEEVLEHFPELKARFFYCAKASTKERGEENKHPTLKPFTLMEYLCKLITPSNGTILDPFMGSGTTGIAAVQNGFGFIGIEQNKEYFNIAVARIKHKLNILKGNNYC